jgi:hypothetical protein
MSFVMAYNVEIMNVRTAANSDMLIPSGNVRVAIVLHLLITLLTRGIEPSDHLLDLREAFCKDLPSVKGDRN